jgi:hypothetical protein
MTELFFLIRHTPFWAVPVLVISLEFGYIFWIRKKHKEFKFCLIAILVSILFLSFYVYTGGPEKSVRKVINIIQHLK